MWERQFREPVAPISNFSDFPAMFRGSFPQTSSTQTFFQTGHDIVQKGMASNLRLGSDCPEVGVMIQLLVISFENSNLTLGSDRLLVNVDKADRQAPGAVGIRGLTCPYCRRPFGQRRDVEVHVSTVHFGARPYACHICSLRFGVKSNLFRHLKTVHQVSRPHHGGAQASPSAIQPVLPHVSKPHDSGSQRIPLTLQGALNSFSANHVSNL